METSSCVGWSADNFFACASGRFVERFFALVRSSNDLNASFTKAGLIGVKMLFPIVPPPTI